MQILYGTGNIAKLNSMIDRVKGLDIDIVGLNSMTSKSFEVDESGNDPLENAEIKARAYYSAYGIPVFSCDSGLYIDGIDEKDQPGVHVRRVRGKVLNDEEMIEYYSKLALRYGGSVKARYRNAICLVMDEYNIFKYAGDDIASTYILLKSKAHEKRTAGFPLDSISVDISSGKYYMDIEDGIDEGESVMTKGFREFFRKALEAYFTRETVEV